MKKGIFLLTLAIVWLLCSCVTEPFEMIGDENNPVENNAVIKFVSDTANGWIILLQWNGIDLKEKLYRNLGTSSEHTAKLTIPAGVNNFVFDITYSTQIPLANVRINYPYESIELQYNLEPGKEYTVEGRFTSGEHFIGIYDTTEADSVLLKEWKIGERQ